MMTESDAWIAWHQWRQWEDGSWGAQRPRGVVDPCGGCGRARSEHPIPNVKISRGEAVAHYLLTLRGVLQRIRAGWLPHAVGPDKDSWWWGRPRSGGFELWRQGLVPSMAVVDPMTEDEIAAWKWSLHSMAPEAGSSGP